MRRFSKVFGIGLSRTGTHSLSRALIQLGLTVVHFPATFAEVEAHDASTDSRVADKLELLDLAFPDSLFILTVRQIEDWLCSCERFWASFRQFADAPDLRVLHDRLYGAADFDRAIYADGYRRYMERVSSHFAKRRGELLEMNICAGDGWPQLAAFLEIPIPPTPFPHDRAPGGSAIARDVDPVR
jgi:hypothetical protein